MSGPYRWYHRLAAWLHDVIAGRLADLATPYWIHLAEEDLEEQYETERWAAARAPWTDDPGGAS